jgi:hypothetical protein
MFYFVLGVLFGVLLIPFLHQLYSEIKQIFAIRRAMQDIGAYTKPRRYYMQQIGEWRDD